VKLWTIGREREKQQVAPHFKDPAERALLFDVIDAVHDLKEGYDKPDKFVPVARRALAEGGAGVVQQTCEWIARVAGHFPEVGALWNELASHPQSKFRFQAASRLYWYIPQDQSNRLFAGLRNDKSKRVREIAVSQYEWRPNENRHLVKTFDADRFDERVRSGEIQL
jgi:hypothetical protein